MIELSIPDFGDVSLKHLVIDYNGTLALDGKLLPGAREVLQAVAAKLDIQVLTADTFGRAAEQLKSIPVTLTILGPDQQAEAKLDFLQHLGVERCVAIGNGRNDRKMLAAAAISIAVIQKEGVSREALASAHVATANVLEALDLLIHPERLTATLRS